ncbi:MAG: hypothetical protein RMJ88_16290, partial [Thermogemmata sp.]|nr:hypothetical protein [Thermogemmata sp.]
IADPHIKVNYDAGNVTELHSVAFTGLTMPLACENISAPLLPRPDKPEEVDVWARRTRKFLEWVVRGLQLVPTICVPIPDPFAQFALILRETQTQKRCY